ncbi:MAG: toll/interleukin-1 receptor domain-containing protein [Nitrospirota bacterium]
MNLLISWSGEKSEQVASILRCALPVFIPGINPWVSSDDLRKGTRWAEGLAERLEDTQYGIFIVFPDNQESPWLNFEAGAISKWVNAGNVAPLLFGLLKSELRGPLAQFQATVFTSEDVYKLLQSINTVAGELVTPTKLQTTFDLMWPGLSEKIAPLINEINIKKVEIGNKLYFDNNLELTQDHTDILKTVGISQSNLMGLSKIIESVRMNQTRVEHFIDDLVRGGYLQKVPTKMGGRGYKVIDKGRKYLIDQGMI